MEEINLYDSLFLPVISGNILIKDALNVGETAHYTQAFVPQ